MRWGPYTGGPRLPKGGGVGGGEDEARDLVGQQLDEGLGRGEGREGGGGSG